MHFGIGSRHVETCRVKKSGNGIQARQQVPVKLRCELGYEFASRCNPSGLCRFKGKRRTSQHPS